MSNRVITAVEIRKMPWGILPCHHKGNHAPAIIIGDSQKPCLSRGQDYCVNRIPIFIVESKLKISLLIIAPDQNPFPGANVAP